MSKHYRIGIVGVGGIAAMHANAIGDLDNATVVAGCCRTQAKGLAFAKIFNCDWYPNAAALMDQAKPDIVCITTPSGAHLEPVKAAAARGIHVICEKPLEITTDRIDEMIAICKQAGIRLGGIFPSRYTPAIKLLRDSVAAGRFGKLAIAAAYCPWWRDDAYYSPDRWQGTLALDGGGAMMNQSIHTIDAIQWIISGHQDFANLSAEQCPIAEVFAYTGKRGHDENLIEVEDTAVAILKFKNGMLGQLLGATSMFPGSNRRICIGGRDGTAEVMEETLTAFAFRDATDQDRQLLEQYSTVSNSTGASDPLAISYEGHTHNIRDILEAIDQGIEPTIDGREARKAVSIIQAIYQSAASGQPVKLT